jgi:hypothetical protein
MCVSAIALFSMIFAFFRGKKSGEQSRLKGRGFAALIILTKWPANGLTGRAAHRSDIRRVWRSGFLECETQPSTDVKTAKLFALVAALAAFQP